MLSINAIKYYSEISDELMRLDDSICFLKNHIPEEETQKLMVDILKSNVNINTYQALYTVNKKADDPSLVKAYSDKYFKFKKEFNFVKFYSVLLNVRQNIIDIFRNYNFESSIIFSLLNSLQELSSIYQEIIQNDDDMSYVESFFNQTKLCCLMYFEILDNIREYINIIGNNKIDIEKNNENLKYLEVQLLDIEFNVDEFSELLKNLDSSYSTICSLNSKVESSHLKIVKIESGSFLSGVLGNPAIIDFIALAFKKIIEKLYASYSTKGRLNINGELMKEISNSADVIKKLEEMDIDTGIAKSNIEAALNVVTNDLFNIAVKAPRIKINDKEYKTTNIDKFLENKQKYLCDDNKEK